MKKLFSLTMNDQKRALLIDPDFAIDSPMAQRNFVSFIS